MALPQLHQWTSVPCLEQILGEVWEFPRSHGVAGTLPLLPFLGLHAVLSTPAWCWDEQAALAWIRPVLYTGHWLFSPSHQLLGKPVTGYTLPPSPRMCYILPLSLLCPNPVHAAFLRGSSCCPLQQWGPQ